MIPYGRQHIDEADIEAVIETLRSDFLTQGPKVPAFEQAVAARLNAKYGVAVNSATSALHVACLALGVQPGDRVWTSPISFVASSNCALYCGASVDFVDIDPVTHNMCADALAAKLEVAAKEGKLPKVVIPVHLCGHSCDMAPISKLAKQYGFGLIEDASHAVGATYKSQPVGNCAFSDIAVFSFHPVKIMTTGEGGVATTNDHALAEKMGLLRSHGVVREPSSFRFEADGPWSYEQQFLGFNYRMTDIAATLGISQLGKLDDFLQRRRDIVDAYAELLADVDVSTPSEAEYAKSSYHLYVIRTAHETGPMNRKEMFGRFRRAGINVNIHYIPIYRHPYYAQMAFDPSHYPNAEAYYSQAISLPIFPDLSSGDLEKIVKVMNMASGYQDLF